MDEQGSSEDSTKIRINPDSLPIEVRELWENMLRIDPSWNFHNWLVECANQEMELLVSKLNDEQLKLEHRQHRIERLIERVERQMSESKRINDPHQKNLFDAYAQPKFEDKPKIVVMQPEEMIPTEDIDAVDDDPILRICCEHILQEMEESQDAVLHEDEMMDICSSLRFDTNEVQEAIEHLVSTNQIMHLGDGLYGFAD
ncbi:MAG: hypothetical protein CMB31_00705 [Euryarchaeota archaeon]|nr:hypothetical protein [Euryarchaeota archaeon]|tara:strand:+ start:1488 stop:2087 length:600 start_codon:yes stop_codon:yes gene_type:complete